MNPLTPYRYATGPRAHRPVGSQRLADISIIYERRWSNGKCGVVVTDHHLLPLYHVFGGDQVALPVCSLPFPHPFLLLLLLLLPQPPSTSHTQLLPILHGVFPSHFLLCTYRNNASAPFPPLCFPLTSAYKERERERER